MTLTLAARLTFDGSKARAELRGAAADTKGLTAATKEAGAGAQKAGADLAAYEAKVAKAEAELRKITSAQVAQASAVRDAAQANVIASGGFGDLADNLNRMLDGLVGSQTPLNVFAQQGTRIGAVYGSAGAGGVLRQFVGAVSSIINPMALLQGAVIGGASALFDWGLKAIGAATAQQTFQERVDASQASINNLNEVVKSYSFEGLVALKAKYGEVNAEILALLENQRLLAQTEATQKVEEAVGAITAELGNGLFSTQSDELQRVLNLGGVEAARLLGAIKDLNNQPLDQQIASMVALKDRLSDVTGGFANMTDEQTEMLRLLSLAEDQMRQLAATAPQANWMNAAISGVNSLIGRIGAAISANARLRASTPATDSGVYGQVGARGDPRQFSAGQSGSFNRPLFEVPGAGAGGGGGGGAAAANAEADAVAKLIQQQQRELDLLRETDPVKKELLRQREALAEATGAERRQIEDLIRTRIAEEEQLKNNNALTDYLNQSASTFLDSLIVKGAKASDVIRNLASSLLQAGIQAFSLGQGPLAGLLGISGGLFGGGGGGGGTGAFGLPRPFATGGQVRGPGTGTSDSILARLSDGEHIINARAASRHRGLLEMINAGVPLPAFARGGQVGPSRGSQRASALGGGSSGSGGFVQHIHIHGATGNREIEELTANAARRGIEAYDREVLPQRVSAISRSPRYRGQ
jgi:hypothetical protein